jgi:hypothetical protein
VILPWAVPAASHLPELLNATFATLGSVGGLFKLTRTTQAERKTTHSESATKGALRVISTIVSNAF